MKNITNDDTVKILKSFNPQKCIHAADPKCGPEFGFRTVVEF